MAPGVLVVVAGLFVVVLVGVVVLVVLLAARRRPAAVAGPGTPVSTPTRDQNAALLRAAAGKEVVVRAVGLVLGAWVGLALSGWDRLGRGLMLAAPAAALVVAASVAAGQFLLRPGTTTVRTASLVPRRIRDYAPTWLSRAVLAATVYLLAFLATTTAVASPDDLGRPGRTLAIVGAGNGCAAWSGPWPGSFYSAPIVAIVAVGLTATLTSLRWVALRPSLTDADGAQADDALRRRACRVLVAAIGVLITVPALGTGLAAAQVLRSLSRNSCGVPLWWGWAEGAIGVMELPLLALLAWCVTMLLAPSVGEPAGKGPARNGAPADTAAPGGRPGA